jgi:hypothetical protein
MNIPWIANFRITCDYPDQTDELLADLIPVLRARIREDFNRGQSTIGPTGFCHIQTFNTGLSIDGAPVQVFLSCRVKRGTLKARSLCHIGHEKNVRAMEGDFQAFMNDLALKGQVKWILQIDPSLS